MSRFFGKTNAGVKTGLNTGTNTGKVVSMDRFRSGKSLSPIRQAEAYWCALRTGATVPRRAQIDPRGLENVLEYAFIVERIAPGVARFRLAGHHLNGLAGMEVRGMPLTTFFTPGARGRISAVLEHMFDTPAVAELTLREEAGRGRTPIEARMILLPLESDLGAVDRALGVLIADGPAAHNPMRFDFVTSSLRPVTGPITEKVADPVASRHAEPAKPREPVPGFAESQETLGRPMSHLRLVK